MDIITTTIPSSIISTNAHTGFHIQSIITMGKRAMAQHGVIILVVDCVLEVCESLLSAFQSDTSRIVRINLLLDEYLLAFRTKQTSTSVYCARAEAALLSSLSMATVFFTIANAIGG